MRSSLSRKEVLTDSSSSSSSSSSSDSDSDFSDRAEHALDAVLSDSSSSSSSSSDGECKHHHKAKKEATADLYCERHGKVHMCRWVKRAAASALPSDPARISVKHVKKALPLAAAAIDSAAAAMQELTVADDHDDAAAAIGTAEQQARLEAIRARPLGAAGDALSAASAAKQPVPGLKPIGRRQQRSARTGRYTKAAAPMPGLRALKPAGANNEGEKGTYLALSDDDAESVSGSSSSSSSSESDTEHARHHQLSEEDEYNKLYNKVAAQIGGPRYVNALITHYHEDHPDIWGHDFTDTLRHGKYAFGPLEHIEYHIEKDGLDHVRAKAAKYYERRAAHIVDNEEARYAKHLPTPNSTHLSARVGAKAASPTSAMPGLVPISSAPRNAAAGKKSVAAKPTIRVKGAAAAPASRRRAAPAKAAISDAY